MKLLVHAFWAALAAFVLGLCLGCTLIRHFGGLYFTGLVLAGAALICVLLWTRHAVRRIAPAKPAPTEAAKNSARQFLWSCIFFALISSGFGLAVSSFIWYGSDFIRTFGVIFWGAITCVAIFPVRRDAKRLSDSVPSQTGRD